MLTNEGPSDTFECNFEVEQAYPASPIRFMLHAQLNELEAL